MNARKPVEKILIDILNIDSPTGKEEQLTDFIANFCKKSTKLQVNQVGKTLCYNFYHAKNVPTIALYGHTDTVSNQQDRPPYMDDEFVYGCGASDMKAGLAVMLDTVQTLANAKAKFNLQLIFYDGEEGPYQQSGLKNALIKLPLLKQASLALVLEPTMATIQNGCLGVINASLVFKGKSAHSARPWEGLNSINKALSSLNKIANYPAKSELISGLKFTETMSITKIKAGDLKNVLPNKCLANLNYRFTPNKSKAQAKKFIFDFLKDVDSLTIDDIAPASKVLTKNQLLDKLISKHKLKTSAKQAWTDIARLNETGIPAVNFGPGDPAYAHQKNEKTPINQLKKTNKILNGFLFG